MKIARLTTFRASRILRPAVRFVHEVSQRLGVLATGVETWKPWGDDAVIRPALGGMVAGGVIAAEQENPCRLNRC